MWVTPQIQIFTVGGRLITFAAMSVKHVARYGNIFEGVKCKKTPDIAVAK